MWRLGSLTWPGGGEAGAADQASGAPGSEAAGSRKQPCTLCDVGCALLVEHAARALLGEPAAHVLGGQGCQPGRQLRPRTGNFLTPQTLVFFFK